MAAPATADPPTTPAEETEPFAGYDSLRYRQTEVAAPADQPTSAGSGR